MIVDAHHHLWTLARGDYAWLTPVLSALYRDFNPPDLDPLLAQCGVTATVLVQAAPTEAETEFLLAVARAWPRVAAVVGWTDLDSPDAPGKIAALAQSPVLKGLRPMLQDEPDAYWLMRPQVARALTVMVELGLTLDALVRPHQLPALCNALEAHPDLRVVIDHAAKPDIAGGRFEPWAQDIRAAASRPNTWCKLSGLLTEAGSNSADPDLAPFVDHLLTCFGPRRVMWGSDWPVLNLAGDYVAWRDQSLRLTGALSAEDRAWVFGRAAAEFYGLESPT